MVIIIIYVHVQIPVIDVCLQKAMFVLQLFFFFTLLCFKTDMVGHFNSVQSPNVALINLAVFCILCINVFTHNIMHFSIRTLFVAV